jgi:hypothetical protein
MYPSKHIIGIDPSFRKAGFAICIIDEHCEVQATMFKSFLEFLRWLTTPGEAPKDAIVGIENSNLQNVTFDMKGTKGVVAKKSRNVGANQAASQYTVDLCRWHYGPENVFEISPKQKGEKWPQAYFRSVAKSNKHNIIGRFNQDQRDAYQIALIAKQSAKIFCKNKI